MLTLCKQYAVVMNSKILIIIRCVPRIVWRVGQVECYGCVSCYVTCYKMFITHTIRSFARGQIHFTFTSFDLYHSLFHIFAILSKISSEISSGAWHWQCEAIQRQMKNSMQRFGWLKRAFVLFVGPFSHSEIDIREMKTYLHSIISYINGTRLGLLTVR